MTASNLNKKLKKKINKKHIMTKDYSNIVLEASDGKKYSIADLVKNSDLLLYFYPKDNTPGCTNQAKDFTRLKKDFADKNIQIVGVSPDNLKSHENFIAKQELDLLLLSDPEKELSTAMEVFGEKKNYGKTYMGIIRSTFWFKKGNLDFEEAWRNVRAKGHGDRMCKIFSEK